MEFRRVMCQAVISIHLISEKKGVGDIGTVEGHDEAFRRFLRQTLLFCGLSGPPLGRTGQGGHLPHAGSPWTCPYSAQPAQWGR